MKFTLPMPPGINRTYGINVDSKSPMYKKKRARDWEKEAGYTIIRQWPGRRDPMQGPVKVGIHWYYKYNIDIDAGLKILLDLLQKMRVYEDDRQVRKIMFIDIDPDPENPRVEVIVMPKLL